MRRRGTVFTAQRDGLSGGDVRRLLACHLAQMHANSPPGTTFALDLAGLMEPGITVWAARDGEQLLAIGALKALGLPLYRRHAFVEGEPFADYAESAFNCFFHLALGEAKAPATANSAS